MELEPPQLILPRDDQDLLGVVRGVRFYSWRRNKNFLTGGTGVRWYSPRQKARCKVLDCGTTRLYLDPSPCDMDPERIPHSNTGSRCGINMFSAFSPEMVATLGDVMREDWGFYGLDVAALTEGWGKVVVHDDGYRVEQARVLELIVPRGRRLRKRDLGKGWADVRVISADFSTAITMITKFLSKSLPVPVPRTEML